MVKNCLSELLKIWDSIYVLKTKREKRKKANYLWVVSYKRSRGRKKERKKEREKERKKKVRKKEKKERKK